MSFHLDFQMYWLKTVQNIPFFSFMLAASVVMSHFLFLLLFFFYVPFMFSLDWFSFKSL